MLIPVFLSAPSIENLNPEQKTGYDAIVSNLEDFGLEARSLGKSDYPAEFPMKEVIHLARQCSGAVILGFTQFVATSGIVKPGSANERPAANVPFPTPWNQLEAGILFTLKLPVLVFKEKGIAGGVFDEGVTDVFVHKMPNAADLDKKSGSARQVLLKWQAKVRSRYYDWES